MRLLIVSSWCPVPAVNGAKQRAFALIRELARRHEIALLTFAEDDEPSQLDQLAPLVAGTSWVAGNPHKPARPLGVREYFGRVPRSYAATFSVEMARRAECAARDADLVLALQIGAAVHVEALRGRPRVFEEAESAGLFDASARAASAAARLRRRLTWWKYSRYVASAVARFEATTVVSARERDLFVAAGANPEKLHIVPNGVDVPEVVARAPIAGRLVYAGSVTYRANLEAVDWFARHVLPLVRSTHPHVQFMVTGSYAGVDRHTLEQLGVVLTGHLDDVRAVLGSAELAVVPILSGGGTRLKILEAMALGIPVVSTSKGAEGLEVRAPEHLLLADSPEEFALAVTRWLDDPAAASRAAAAARDLVKDRYTWRAAAERLEQVLDIAVARFRERVP